MSFAVRAAVALALVAVPASSVVLWAEQAETRLERAEDRGDEQEVAVARAADEEYCNPALKKILRRVLQSCGLLQQGSGRGCKPVEARNVATMSGSDFNALFGPMKDRGGIVQFDQDSAELDSRDAKLIEDVFSQRRGASYFFVVARASPEGARRHNRQLSRDRAKAVLEHLRAEFEDAQLDKQVGLLWLGEEYAQLDTGFCEWRRSGGKGACGSRDLNRSAFIAWIDCRL